MGSWAGLGGGAHRPSGWLDIAGWSCRIDLHPIACGSSGALRRWTVVGGGGARDGGAGRRDPAHRIGGGAGAVGRRRRGSSVEPAPQCRAGGDPKAHAPAARLASMQILKNLIQNLCGPRSGENFSKPQWEPACWPCITPIPMVPQPHFPSLRRSAHADRFAKCPPRVLRAAQPRTQPRTRMYAVYPPLRLTALAKF